MLTGGEGFTDAMTFAFADREAGFFGLARAGVADGQGSALGVLFAGREPVSLVAEGDHPVEDADWDDLNLPGLSVRTIEPHARWEVVLATEPGFELEFEAASPPAEFEPLGGMEGHERLCRVRGTAAGRPIDCLGQRGRSWGTADWSEHRADAFARRVARRGAVGGLLGGAAGGRGEPCRGGEWGALLDADGAVAMADPRLSTTYDGDGRQRRAGLELWVGEDDDYPRRGAGQVLCGSSVELGSLRLDLAFFGWTLDGRRGVGRYDVLRRA